MIRKLVPFNKKNLIFTLVFSFLIIAFTIFQMIILWLTKIHFSIYFISNVKRSLMTQIMAISLLSINLIINSILIYQYIISFKRKMLWRNDKLILFILGFTLIGYFLIPSSIPMNYVIPILMIFYYVSYKYQFAN